MLEMSAEYMKVVPDLTIDNADRLKLTKMMSDNIWEMENE